MKIKTNWGQEAWSFKLFGIIKRQGEYEEGHIFSRYAGHELWPAYKIGNYGIYLHPALQRIVTLPERAWRYVLCRLWLDRLTFQYEAGYAAGLKEGVKNASSYACAFDGLTPEEYEALGDGFSNDERRDAKELASLESLNSKGAFQPQIDILKARMKQRATIARWKEERGVLAK